jgi:glucosyl-dolichyl phosphate glucuronosyltransferase
MKVTVILCTYNRCRDLARALDSILASELPDSVQWEVLVVDNNSSDQTRETIEGFCRRYPGRLRYLFERQPGKSYALNAGIRQASGDVLAFADDDARVGTTWLWNLTQCLSNGDWAGAGGRIILQWPPSLPPWLSTEGPHSRHCFPGFDHGQEARMLNAPPFGANMAFRREVFDRYGVFRTDLGPSACVEVPPHSEDTEFGRRVIAGGERLRYEPSAVVYHPVTEERINKEYFLKWRFDLGRANFRIFGIRPGTKWFIDGIPLYLFRRLAAWTVRWMFSFEPSSRFSRKVTVWEEAGEIAECSRQSRTLHEREGG